MSQTTLHGRILTPCGWIDGTIQWTAPESDTRTAPRSGPRAPDAPGTVVAIDGVPVSDADVAAALASGTSPRWILPGFIDLHVHGGGGADAMEGAAAVSVIARTHAAYGTTSFLITTMTAPRAELDTVLPALAACCLPGATDGATPLGLHLEGPYLNPGRLGAQPDAAVTATLDEVLHYLGLAPIRVLTLAPEIHDRLDIIGELARRGVRVQMGHSLATYEQACDALHHGASGFTHLFNAMTPLQHRAPGVVGAALAHADYAELIPDLLHVHPGAMRAAFRAIPHLYCVTDGTAACGMPDGDYKLGSQPVNKCLGAVRLADGTLAGSALTMDQALRNLVEIGLPLADASRRLSQYPADYLDETQRGRLTTGALADIVVLDAGLRVLDVFVSGRHIALPA
ncbi:N-acetylglucosamine-6-phosphate deacetylase [Robbsia sp. KACC 23696]|uniref:N-acetylglucosamine-6-phosphate deacetylase n=1 Tax=Robbsia sp. KACC 23696 TaxID=3149231 RepID=UPI00325B45C2